MNSPIFSNFACSGTRVRAGVIDTACGEKAVPSFDELVAPFIGVVEAFGTLPKVKVAGFCEGCGNATRGTVLVGGATSSLSNAMPFSRLFFSSLAIER